jgi:RNA polymerase sigma factor (sigma-70 family)
MATRLTSLPGLLKSVQSEALAALSDRHLLERFAEAGDEAAFAAILDRHGPMLLGLCRRLLGDAHRAEDVLQATLIVLARKARAIRRRESLAGWLYGVAQRLARQVRLAEAARARRERRAAGGRGEAAAGDPGWDELLRVLDEELQRLPERFRTPLLLCYLEGRTQDEAARQLGWSLSTLRRRLEGGRELLRARMTRRGATLGAGLFAGFLAPSAARAALPAPLRQAVLTAASAGGRGAALPASILVLVNGGMRMTTAAKVFLGSVLAVVAGGVLAGVAWQTGPATGAVEPPAQPQPAAARPAGPNERPALGRDRFNDPLPGGAVARLGTVAFRHGQIAWGGSLTFTPNGKHLISTGGRWVRKWDLATGHADVSLSEGPKQGPVAVTLTTADGKRAWVCNDVDSPTRAPWQCSEFDLESGKKRTYHLDFPRGLQEEAFGLPPILSPDGKTHAGLGTSGTLVLWNTADGTVLHQFEPQGKAYTALVFPPDGKTVIAGDEGHTFRVFELATGKELRSFGIPNANAVARMAVSPDGKWLATLGGVKGSDNASVPHDRFVRLWKRGEGTVARIIPFPKYLWVEALQFTPDSRTLIAGIRVRLGGTSHGHRDVVRSWDVATGKPGRAWTDDPAAGVTVAVSPDGKTLATMSSQGVIRLWDRETGAERRPLEASPCSLEAVCFRPDGKTILTVGSPDLALREWEAATGRLLGPPRARVPGSSPTFVAKGKFLVSLFEKDKDTILVRVHDAATGKLLLEQPGHWPVVTPDGRRLAMVDKDHVLRILDLPAGKVIQTQQLPAEGKGRGWPRPRLLSFTPDGQSLILQGESLSVWDLRTGKPKSSWKLGDKKLLEKPDDPAEYSWERIVSAAVSPDGSQVACALLKEQPKERGFPDWFWRLMLFETATGKLLHQLDVDRECFEHLAFSPDGKSLALGGPRTVRLLDVATGKVARQFEGHRGRVNALAFSPDSKRLASASEDSTVLVWDVAR